MTKPPRAVLFDLDGVLVDSYWVWFHLLNRMARVLDYPEIAHEVYETGWGQSTTADRDAFFRTTPSPKSRPFMTSITSSISSICVSHPKCRRSSRV